MWLNEEERKARQLQDFLEGLSQVEAVEFAGVCKLLGVRLCVVEDDGVTLRATANANDPMELSSSKIVEDEVEGARTMGRSMGEEMMAAPAAENNSLPSLSAQKPTPRPYHELLEDVIDRFVGLRAKRRKELVKLVRDVSKAHVRGGADGCKK